MRAFLSARLCVSWNEHSSLGSFKWDFFLEFSYNVTLCKCYSQNRTTTNTIQKKPKLFSGSFFRNIAKRVRRLARARSQGKGTWYAMRCDVVYTRCFLYIISWEKSRAKRSLIFNIKVPSLGVQSRAWKIRAELSFLFSGFLVYARLTKTMSYICIAIIQ